MSATFDRPHRTATMRLVNRAGRALRRRGLKRPLSVEDVLRRARRRTGLTDFGGEEFLEPLEVLVESLEADAELSPFGRWLVRQNLVNACANRARVERALEREPAAAGRGLPRPLFVLGLPRTGTTLLQQLLACDPRRRPLACWESFFPAPLSRWPGRGPELRPLLGRILVRSVNRVAPQLKWIHPLAADEPEECTWLLANTFMTSAFSLFGRVAGYERWLDAASDERIDAAYRHFARQLECLQGAEEERTWILKSPVHLRSLGSLLRVFPDARVVQLHRDPLAVVPSACSLFAVTRGIYSDAVDPKTLGPEMLEKLVEALSRAARARAEAGGRVLDLRFEDLIEDKIGTVRRIQEHFGEEPDPRAEAAMRDWLAQDAHAGAHRYHLEQFGLTAEQVERAFAERATS